MYDMSEKLAAGLEQLQWQHVGDDAVAAYKVIEPRIKEAWAQNPFTVRRLLEAIDIAPGTYPGGIPNNPKPLRSMLVGGLAGAALGHGVGWLGEKILPDRWKRNRLRWTLTMLGAGLGGAPGAGWGLVNVLNNKPFNDTSLIQDNPLMLPAPNYQDPSKEQMQKNIVTSPYDPAKVASDLFNETPLYGMAGIAAPPVPVDTFNRVLWTDPRVSDRLSPATRGAATGLMTAAANLPGKLQTRFVTPFDVARIAAGMGSGYLSGKLVGKGLGLLMGMPEETQEKLKNTGMFAGIIANLVPMAFGG
mgnify:CR=1 FL=1